MASLVLRILGWKIVGELPADGKKCVVMMAPHTSNIDFVFGWLGYSSLGINSHFLIKKEAFKWFSSPLLNALGGIPVNRGRSANLVFQLTEEFEKREQLILTITPEGTRKPNKHWKKGYYLIAQHAGVPLVMGFLDYKTKTGGLGPSFRPSGNYEADLEKIRAFYKTKTARHPENFCLPMLHEYPGQSMDASVQAKAL